MAGLDDINSIIAADFGSVNTRVVLIDLVDGAYRMVAQSVTRTTADDPVRDVAVGLYRTVQQMSEQTGRTLLVESGDEIMRPERKDGSGVDVFLATASVGQPLRVVVVGLMPDVSVSSALHVLAGSYVQVVDRISLADVRTDEQQINAILARKPDLIFIVGGTDAGAEAPILGLVKTVRSAVRIAAKRPMVLYAGNRAVQSEVRSLLDDLTTLIVADNVRPSLMDEDLSSAQQGLAAIYNEYKVSSGGGFDEVSNASRFGVLPTVQSYTNIVRYLGETVQQDKNTPGAGVLAVDIGSSTTTVAASIRRKPLINIRTDIGVGHSAAGTWEATTPANLRRWLTWDATDAELANYAHNKSLRPATVPQTENGLELEYAFAREAMRIVVDQARQNWPVAVSSSVALRPIIGAGTVLSQAPHSGYAAMLMLDAIQPVGLTEIWLDPAGLIPALGTVAYLQPSAVVQMLDEGDLLKVGSVVCVEGRVRRIGRGGMRVKIKLSDGQEVRQEVAAGMIWTYPLPPGQIASVEIRLSRGLTVNGKSNLKLKLEGGAAGLIFDVRGRPLPLPRDADVRALLYPRWVDGTRGTVRQRIADEEESVVDEKTLGKVALVDSTDVEQVLLDDKPVEGLVEVQEPPPKRGLLGFLRRRKPAKQLELPESGEEGSDFMAHIEAIAAARGATADGVEGEAPVPEKRRGLFGRRKAESVQESDSGDNEAIMSELDEMMDELREDVQPSDKKRKGLFR